MHPSSVGTELVPTVKCELDSYILQSILKSLSFLFVSLLLLSFFLFIPSSSSSSLHIATKFEDNCF